MALTVYQRTQRIRRKRRANGLCLFCARPIAPGSLSQCETHLAKTRVRPENTIWQPGGPGRPPVWALQGKG